MPKQTWIIATVLSAVVVIGLIGVTLWQQGRQLDELRAIAEQNRKQAEALKSDLGASKAQIDELQQEKEAATQAQKNLEKEMRGALESKDITISQLQGKLTVSILDRILFDSGEAVLKPEGEQVLRQIAAVLTQFPNRQIHVIGHTDNVPIRASAKNRFASNWELSTARATAAVRFLCEQAGVDPRRLGAVGYGEFHPIADNSTPDGRARNRRIALVVLSEEMAGSDASPTAVPITPPLGLEGTTTNRPAAGLTNAPPPSPPDSGSTGSKDQTPPAPKPALPLMTNTPANGTN